MLLAQLDDSVERSGRHFAIIGGEALEQAARPIGDRDRPQCVETAEAAERTVRWSEQVAHHVLEAAGEQVAHLGASLEYRSHPFRHGIGIAIGSPVAGDFLKLVEEHDHSSAVGASNPIRKFECEVKSTLRILGCPARRDRELYRVAKLALELQHSRGLGRVQGDPTYLSGAADEAVDRRSVGDYRG